MRAMSDCLIPIGIRDVQTDIEARPLTEILEDPDLEQEAEWLVAGYAGRGILTLVSGHPKVGKTTWLAHLASAVAVGKWFLGAPTTQGRVLWLDLEQHPARTAALFRGLGDEGIDVSHTPRPPSDAIRRYITEHDIGLVVVDSLSKLLGLEDENDAAAVTLALSSWLELCRDTNTGMLAIHHLRKSGGADNLDVRGSSAINAIVDISIAIRPTRTAGMGPENWKRSLATERRPTASWWSWRTASTTAGGPWLNSEPNKTAKASLRCSPRNPPPPRSLGRPPEWAGPWPLRR